VTQTRDEQLLDAYRHHRVEDQVGYYERRSGDYERARRLSVTITALLLVLAALFGALGAADANRRAVWAFTAAAFAALGTALTTFESAFGFERLSRQFGETGAAVALRNAQGPKDGKGVPGFVEDVEGILRSEVDRWSQQADPFAVEQGAPKGTPREEAESASDATSGRSVMSTPPEPG
jgi:hypothetical protein